MHLLVISHKYVVYFHQSMHICPCGLSCELSTCLLWGAVCMKNSMMLGKNYV